ncbi:hypothetical protein O1M54_25905 [Streptomyces diastatochromogenes]|nr:hypothetical protein [Streptomyces diastatochromogenes]
MTLAEPDADGRGEVLIASAAPALGILTDGPGTTPRTFHVEPMPLSCAPATSASAPTVTW